MKLNESDKDTVGKWIIIIILIFFIWLLSGCKTEMVYVPVETVKTEYIDRLQRDSVHLYDSVFMKLKGDTIWLEKYKYLYRDKLVRDSIFKTDSIQVPFPVEVEKEVNRLTSFQSFQVWCGRILLLLIVGYLAFRWVKRFV